jgi:hypothetical protein
LNACAKKAIAIAHILKTAKFRLNLQEEMKLAMHRKEIVFARKKHFWRLKRLSLLADGEI